MGLWLGGLTGSGAVSPLYRFCSVRPLAGVGGGGAGGAGVNAGWGAMGGGGGVKEEGGVIISHKFIFR